MFKTYFVSVLILSSILFNLIHKKIYLPWDRAILRLQRPWSCTSRWCHWAPLNCRSDLLSRCSWCWKPETDHLEHTLHVDYNQAHKDIIGEGMWSAVPWHGTLLSKMTWKQFTPHLFYHCPGPGCWCSSMFWLSSVVLSRRQVSAGSCFPPLDLTRCPPAAAEAVPVAV